MKSGERDQPDQFNLALPSLIGGSRNGRNAEDAHPPAFLAPGFDLNMAMGVLVQSMDPIALKVVVGSMPQVRPELKADLYGICGSRAWPRERRG